MKTYAIQNSPSTKYVLPSHWSHNKDHEGEKVFNGTIIFAADDAEFIRKAQEYYSGYFCLKTTVEILGYGIRVSASQDRFNVSFDTSAEVIETVFPITVKWWNNTGETKPEKFANAEELLIAEDAANKGLWQDNQGQIWGNPMPEIIKASRIVLLNTSILTTDGRFSLETVTLDRAKALLPDAEILSAIGHASTAEILTELLGVPVAMNRIEYVQQPGDICIVFKMNGRPAEGHIMNREEMEKMGYSFKILTMI